MNESEWLVIFEDCHSSGLDIKQWCRNKGIKYNSYLYWFKSSSLSIWNGPRYKSLLQMILEMVFGQGNSFLILDLKEEIKQWKVKE